VKISGGDDQVDSTLVDVGKGAAAEVRPSIGDGKRTSRSPRITANIPRPASAQPQPFVA
jgi:hypothetical protein